MALMDRFRAQAGPKHPDATVRLSFVQELPLDERDLLGEIAREDTDPRVRRAAVAKLMDPPALAGVARNDADESVRALAATMLRDIALEVFDGLGEPEGVAAVDALVALADAKMLTAVAKSAPRESTAQRALATVTDARTLGSVARHSAHEAIRLAAFAALEDHGEVLSVALNSEFKDPTLAAVERISARGELEQIAGRAKNKSAAKRARALLREEDERQEQAARAAAAAAAEALALASQPDPAELERRALAEAARRAADEQARADEAAHLLEQDEASVRRREEEAVAERARAEAAAEAAAKDAERRQVRLAELLVEAEAASADEDLVSARRRMGAVHRECRDLPKGADLEGDFAAQMAAADARFTAREAAAREDDQRARREALTRMHQFLARIEPLAGMADLTLKAGERALKDMRTLLGAMPQLPSKRDYDEAMQRLKAAQTALTPKVQELRDVADWQRWANIGIQEQLCEKMEALKAVEDPEAIAKHVKDFQEQWRQASDVPRAQGDVLWRRFKTAHDEAWKRCEEHFAAQAVARAETLAKKIALCERAEALSDSTAWIQTADEIKQLQAEWKALGPVTRGQEKATWERFRAACDRFFSRRHADLADRKKAWAENLARKEALSTKAEALVESTDWEAAATAIRQLQAEWKTIGAVRKTRSDAIWQRFRAACDAFFARYVQRHDIARGERVAAREAICADLEALAPAFAGDAGLGGASPVTSHESPATSDQPSATSEEPAAAGEEPSAVSAESAAPGIGGASPATSEAPPATSPQPLATSEAPPADLVATVRAIRSRWQQELAARGVESGRAAALDARFSAAFTRVVTRWPAAFGGTDLDPDANRKKMEILAHRMEELARSMGGAGRTDADAALSPTTRLAAMLKEALASNTIGGKVDDDSRWRAASEDMRQAQSLWTRIGPVPERDRRPLSDRFNRACRQIADATARASATARAQPTPSQGARPQSSGPRPSGPGGSRR